MRVSDEKKFSVTRIDDDRQAKTHKKIFECVAGETTEADRRGMVMLAGGNGVDDLKIRHAQAIHRFDLLPSYWSQAAIIVHWPDGAKKSEVIGLEVPNPLGLGPDVLPERNGVREFRLADYFDRGRYPNLGFGTIRALSASPGTKKSAKKSAAEDSAWQVLADKDELVRIACEPSVDRLRYRLWDWLGPWSRYVLSGGENPLESGIPHPGASFCEFVYQSAGIDLSPGLTDPGCSPETIWSTLLYWTTRLARDSSRLAAWASVVEDEISVRPSRGLDFDCRDYGVAPRAPRKDDGA